MPLWVKVLAKKNPDNLGSMPGTYIKEKTNLTKLSSGLHIYAVTHACPLPIIIHKHLNDNNNEPPLFKKLPRKHFCGKLILRNF